MAATTLDGVLLHGTSAGRPAANTVAKGSIYFATDTNVASQSDGSSWTTIIAGGGLADPMTTRGDIIVRNASNATARLAVGAANRSLISDGTDISWGQILPATLDVSADNTTADATTGHHGLLPKLGGGTSNFLRADGTWAAPPGGGSLTTIDAPATGDTTQVNANTFYDAAGVSASFAAGTWLIIWHLLESIIVGTGQSYVFTVRVWDGTTTYDEVESTAAYTSTNVNGFPWLISGGGLIVVGSTATLKLSAASIRGSSASKIARDVPDNGSSNHTATRLSAVKVA